MPYICLATATVPGGVLQITDLWPNESQRNGVLDPPGQNRYLRRPFNDILGLSGAGPVSVEGVMTSAGKTHLEGLGAYLADVVDPGGTEQATGTVAPNAPVVGDTLTFTGPDGVGTVVFTAVENNATGTVTVVAPAAGVAALTLGGLAFDCVEDFATGTIQILGGSVAGDIVTIAGVPFTAVNGGANPANQEFNDVFSAGTAVDSAASLVTAINNAASQALLTAALDALVAAATGGTLTAANGGTDTVTLTPSVAGAWGDASLAENSAGARITLSGAAMTHTDPNPAAQEFGSAAHYEGSAVVAAAVATSLAAAINDAATTAAMDALNPGGAFPGTDGHMTAVANATVDGVVDLTASVVGWAGLLTLATADAINLAISGANLGNIAANAAALEFDSFLNSATGDDAGVRTSLAAVLNNAATDAALLAIGGSSVTAVAGVLSVSITADTAGSVGAMAVTPSDPVTLVVSAGALAKTMVAWTGDLLNGAAAAVQALVDTGAACTAVGINAAINGVAGVSGVDVTLGLSSVADILSILAGRVYRLPAGTVKDPTGVNWDAATQEGSFTAPNTVYDSVMQNGEWGATASKWRKTGGNAGGNRPTFSGGDVVNNEVGGVRTTVDSTHFAASLATGQLSRYAAGVTLFPDADVRAFVSDWTRRTNRQATINNQRVVTVYDDDGSVLA